MNSTYTRSGHTSTFSLSSASCGGSPFSARKSFSRACFMEYQRKNGTRNNSAVIGMLSGLNTMRRKLASVMPHRKKIASSAKNTMPPAGVHSRSSFRRRLSWYSLPLVGKRKKNPTMKMENRMAGLETQLKNCLSISLGYRSRRPYVGPEIPPSFRMRQKWTIIRIMTMNGTPMQCST